MTTNRVEKNRIRVALYICMILVLVFSAVQVLGAPGAPTTLNEDSDTTRDLSSLGDQTVEAQAGNITELTIEGLSITNYWQGFFGNISGTITLDDANNNTFYNWSTSSPQGEIYATRSNSVDFTNDVACATPAEIAAEATTIGQSGSEGDHITSTFNTLTHPTFNVGSTAITTNTCNSTNTFVSDAAQATDFHEVLLADGAGVFIYTAIIDQDTIGFDGTSHDFQMLVGENGSLAATTPYYFYVELN